MLVAPPDYAGLTVVVDVHARGTLRRRRRSTTTCCGRVYGLLDPLTGGPDGTGWPFGRSVQSHEVHAALARIPGVDMAQEMSVTLFPADPDTGRRQSAGPAARPAADRPVFSYEHQVRVQ